MPSIKPISRGAGPEEYTLFFPYNVRDDAEPFDLDILLNSLAQIFPGNIKIDSLNDNGMDTLKISGFRTHADGVNAFALLKRSFVFLAIESDVTIHINESLTEIDKPFGGFPASWQDGIDAGWFADSETGLIKIDGVANIVFPVIVPEHKRIVKSGALVGRLRRRIKNDLIPKSIECAKVSDKLNNQRLDLAIKAYMNAFSHENTALRFLSLTTCLEILSERKRKGATFISVKNRVIDLIGSMQYLSEDEKSAAESIVLHIENFKKQSITEALVDLIHREEELISNCLPMDHPFKSNPKDAVREMYSIRSNIAHQAQWGRPIGEKLHRSLQFVHCSAKALLKKKLAFI